MCGICGLIAPSVPVELARRAVRDMTAALAYRGPDDEGCLDDPERGVYLGHRRLSIIDLSARARQPLFNEDRSLAVVCNGELYGFSTLRDDLTSRGHHFGSRSDSEVIIHAYEEWGEACWERFDGIFAAALYDRNRRRVILARDAFGVKPLLYVRGRDWLAFASEFRALRCLPKELWTPTLDYERAAELLDYPHLLDTEATLIPGMRMLPPAAALSIDPENPGRAVAARRYWTLRCDPATERLGWGEACRAVEADLEAAVDRQMVADVPVAILLSGGLDSSTLAALAARRTREPLRTFTAVFQHELDERVHARAVARHIGADHTEVSIDPAEVNRRFEEIIASYDDLRSVEAGQFSLFIISEKIRPFGVKVLLFGEGADEVFNGYSWYGLTRLPFSALPRPAISALHHYAVSRTFLRASNWRHAARFDRLAAGQGEPDICRRIARMDIEHQLPNFILMKVDRATMAHGLEGRVPFLDRALVERVFSLPRTYKYAGKWIRNSPTDAKHILRAIAARHLPTGIADRKKQGFMISMGEVLKSDAAKVRDYVTASGSLTRRFLTPRKIESLFRYRYARYSPLDKEREFLLWRCFMLDVWASINGLR